MATRIFKWTARDGSEWATDTEADKRDELLDVCDDWTQRLGKPVSECHERTHVDRNEWRDVKAEFVAYMREKYPTEKVWQHDAEKIHPMSYAGRMLDDVGGPLNRVWHRFMCESDGYEYQQPFYALNPGEWEKAAAIVSSR